MLKLTLATPTKKLLYDAEIEEIFVPAQKGELNILPGHSPLLTTLVTGVMAYRLKGETELKKVVISWGFLEVMGDTVSVLAETAEAKEEIDKDRAKKAYAEAQKRLSQAGLGESELVKYQRKLERAQVRLDAQ